MSGKSDPFDLFREVFGGPEPEVPVDLKTQRERAADAADRAGAHALADLWRGPEPVAEGRAGA